MLLTKKNKKRAIPNFFIALILVGGIQPGMWKIH